MMYYNMILGLKARKATPPPEGHPHRGCRNSLQTPVVFCVFVVFVV